MTAPAAILPPKPQVCPANEKTMVIRLIPELAKQIGLNESVMLLQLAFWIGSANTGRFIDGSWWTWQSVRDLQDKVFSYWSLSTINRTIASLVQGGFIIEGNHNEKKYDKTRWFALNLDNVGKLPGITVITGCMVETEDTPEPAQIDPDVSQTETGSGQNDTRSNHFDTRSTQNETTIPEKSSETTTEISSETKDKTDNQPVANPELPDPEQVVLSVSENPEQSPIIELDNPHGEPGQEKHQPPEARAIVPPASIFVLEETPSKHEPAAQLQPVQSEVSSTPPPVRFNPLPEPELFENFLTDEFEDDREIPGLKPGDPPLYKPDLQWKKVQEAFEDVVGGTIGKTISDALNDGISIRGAGAVVSLIKSAVKADDRLRYVMGSLKKWHDEPVPRPPKNSKEKRVDDGIIWNDDGSLGGYT